MRASLNRKHQSRRHEGSNLPSTPCHTDKASSPASVRENGQSVTSREGSFKPSNNPFNVLADLNDGPCRLSPRFMRKEKDLRSAISERRRKRIQTRGRKPTRRVDAHISAAVDDFVNSSYHSQTAPRATSRAVANPPPESGVAETSDKPDESDIAPITEDCLTVSPTEPPGQSRALFRWVPFHQAEYLHPPAEDKSPTLDDICSNIPTMNADLFRVLYSMPPKSSISMPAITQLDVSPAEAFDARSVQNLLDYVFEQTSHGEVAYATAAADENNRGDDNVVADNGKDISDSHPHGCRYKEFNAARLPVFPFKVTASSENLLQTAAAQELPMASPDELDEHISDQLDFVFVEDDTLDDEELLGCTLWNDADDDAHASR